MFKAILFAAMVLPAMAQAEMNIETADVTEMEAVTMNDVTCSNVIEELQRYQTETASLYRRNVDTLYNVAHVIQSWYSHFSQYEGRNVHITYGTFRNFRTSAQTASSNAAYYHNQFTNSQNRLNYLIDSVRDCLR